MDEHPRAKRKTYLIVLLVLVPTLLFLGLSQASFNLSFIHPSSAQETILLLALSNFIFLAFVIFALILGRILLKLYAERKQEQLGSRFKTKMVVAFLALSLVPVCFLFVFAYGLLNRTIDKWFGIPFDVVRKDANQVVEQLELQAQQKALRDAGHLAGNPDLAAALARKDVPGIEQQLAKERDELDLLEALCFSPDGRFLARSGQPEPSPRQIAQLFPGLAAGRVQDTAPPRPFGSGDAALLVAARAVSSGSRSLGTVVAVTGPPVNIRKMAGEIRQEAQKYDELNRNQKAVKRNALSILGLLTLLILFVATWFALFLSKQVTVPIQALAEGTHQVSRGNLGFQVGARADDELGILIHSFNEMTRQLQENRLAIEQAARELQQANRELEERSNTMATILENVSVGVISFDPQGRMTQANPSAARMLGDRKVRSSETWADLFSAEDAREISRLFRRAARQGVVTRQMELDLEGGRAYVALTVSSIRARHGPVGSVMVLEDLTELVRGQKAAAWREVAQRVAHEIKNPLTPIQLSAERIQRLLARTASGPAEAELASAIAESAALIDREVATLKTLVDEFSSFARFPASQPVPADLPGILEEALKVFNGRLGGISIHRDFGANLPRVKADPEQMKRAVINLIDNAAEAVEESAVKEIWVRAAPDPGREVVELVVADSGPGISLQAKERLFLPYFSTKRRGTGLGLAIVSRIVSEHHGTIRAEENRPAGTRFIIELPVDHTPAPDEKVLAAGA